jgi:hypothetical protein
LAPLHPRDDFLETDGGSAENSPAKLLGHDGNDKGSERRKAERKAKDFPCTDESSSQAITRRNLGRPALLPVRTLKNTGSMVRDHFLPGSSKEPVFCGEDRI